MPKVGLPYVAHGLSGPEPVRGLDPLGYLFEDRVLISDVIIRSSTFVIRIFRFVLRR